MNELKVRIEKLEPMRVARVQAISETPERDAWQKMRKWAFSKGLLDDLDKNPVFGFNNPGPAPGRRKYGYKFWIRADTDTVGEGEIEVQDFAGGLYAVTTCKLFGDPLGSVPDVWQKLWQWVKASRYRWSRTHELERLHNPRATERNMVLDLYLPIEERGESMQ